jgi:sterol desaturase/sphingolipid hydroxylase (fatty acid hydroxylase superfamily)
MMNIPFGQVLEQQVIENLQSIQTYLLNFSLVFFGITLAEIIVDFCFRKQRDYGETATNLGVGIVYELFVACISDVAAIAGLSVFALLSPFKIPINVGTTLLAILMADFLYYWNHRIEHRMRFFWAYHSVHHSSTDFDLTVAMRLAWVENFIIWVFYIPMALLGFHPFQILTAVAIVGLYQISLHTQKIGRLGILESILNTPSNHRVHHGANQQYIDKNYGGILIIWDRLFGTYEPEKEKVVYGLTENVKTRNPVWINIVEYVRIVRDVMRAQTLKDKFLSLFAPPEWKPQTHKQLPSNFHNPS